MKKNLVLWTTVCALSLSATPGYAGFEWRGPQSETQGFEVEAAPVAPVDKMAPIETIETTEDYSADPYSAPPESAPASDERDIEHHVVSEDETQPVAAPDQETVRREEIRWNETRTRAEEAPFEPSGRDDIGQIIRSLNDQNAAVAEEQVEEPDVAAQQTATSRAAGDPEGYYGFGRDMPMVMAMKQILPEGYSPAFARNIDMGQRITWNGDGNWQSTLRRALNDIGLDFYLEGQNIYVTRDESAALDDAEALPAQGWTPPPAYDTGATAQADQEMAPQLLSEPLDRQPVAAPSAESEYQSIGTPDSVSEPIRETAALPVSQAEETASETASLAETSNIAETSDAVVEDIPNAAEDDVEISASVEAEPVNVAAVDRSLPEEAAADSALGAMWSAEANETLQDTLVKWAEQEGTTLRWATDYDYLLKRPVNFSGNFPTAVQNLLEQFATVEPRPYGELYMADAESGDQPVLVVKAYGAE